MTTTTREYKTALGTKKHWAELHNFTHQKWEEKKSTEFFSSTDERGELIKVMYIL